MSFEEISLRDEKSNLVRDIAEEWMLVTAGDETGYNMMTASWGFVGEMWGSDAVMAVIRPQRYTMEFLQQYDRFTLSFYGTRKDIHKICGNQSGREVDKTKLTGLTPVFQDGTVYFAEARLVLVCKKEYVQSMEPECFVSDEPLRWYPDADYHTMIIGKVEKVLVQK